jgi:hypothetical protein
MATQEGNNPNLDLFYHEIRFTPPALFYTGGRVETSPGQVKTSERMSLLNSISHAKFLPDCGFRFLFVLYNSDGKVNGFKHHTLKGTVTLVCTITLCNFVVW